MNAGRPSEQGSPPPDESPVDRALPGLPGRLGIRLTALGPNRVQATLTVTDAHLVPGTGYVHAAAVVALADTACGYGARAVLPAGSTGFTTIELKSNHLGSARPGDSLSCTANCAHAGGTTQVWDAVVTTDAAPRPIALFRCTQLVLYPRPGTTQAKATP